MPTPDDSLRDFASRPWDEIEGLKRRYWADSDMKPEELLRVAEELRLYAVSVRPDWPDDAQRQADLDSHIRIAHLLLKTAHERDQ